ncbi:MAG: GNAT family N-acetyltransferase [Magnetococcales bacterium]|nr:GNAT family N-acetyltransferase [Magnetococcales bacterium]
MATRIIPYWIVPVTLVHLPEIVALEQRIAAYPWQYALFQDELRAEWRQRSLHRVLLAPPDDRVVGFVFCRALVDNEWSLLNIGIVSELRGCGWGERLLRLVMRHSAKCEDATWLLEVAVTNRAARRLYEKCGLSVIGVRRGYYVSAAGHEDALVMQCLVRGNNP